jgi:hypothetical protein
MSQIQDGLVAAFLTKPLASAGICGRKEPLVFARRTRRAEFFTLPPEPEDARLTGATRSLYRRLLALNLGPSARLPVTGVALAPQSVLTVSKIA